MITLPKIGKWTSLCYKSCKIILFQFYCYQLIHILIKRSLPQDHRPNKPQVLQYGVFANSLVMEMNDAFQPFYNKCVIFTYPRVSHADGKCLQAQCIKSQPVQIAKPQTNIVITRTRLNPCNHKTRKVRNS